jgi:hypothetical protein
MTSNSFSASAMPAGKIAVEAPAVLLELRGVRSSSRPAPARRGSTPDPSAPGFRSAPSKCVAPPQVAAAAPRAPPPQFLQLLLASGRVGHRLEPALELAASRMVGPEVDQGLERERRQAVAAALEVLLEHLLGLHHLGVLFLRLLLFAQPRLQALEARMVGASRVGLLGELARFVAAAGGEGLLRPLHQLPGLQTFLAARSICAIRSSRSSFDSSREVSRGSPPAGLTAGAAGLTVGSLAVRACTSIS